MIKNIDEQKFNETTKQFLLHTLESPYGLAEDEAQPSFSMADVIEWLESEGVEARRTLVRKFDALVGARRSEKGAEQAKYREYDKADVVLLKVFLVLRSLGFTKKQITRFWEQYKLLLQAISELAPRGGLKVTRHPAGGLRSEVDIEDLSKPEIQPKVEQYKARLHEVQRFQREVAERAAKLHKIADMAQGLMNNFTQPFSFQSGAITDALHAGRGKARS